MTHINMEIKRMWETHRIGEIAKIVGLTYLAVQHRGRRMGLPHKKKTGAARMISFDADLSPLGIAPGHFAADQRSYDLLRKAFTDDHP